jgi:HSP20 family molecular chaperone IbpA
MRLRYKQVTYHFGSDQDMQQSVERHYQKLMDEVLHAGAQHHLNALVTEWRPPTDIHETGAAILVKMELAGMREEDIEVTLYEDALVVSGTRQDDVDHESEMSYHEAQIRYGVFRAEILLPCPVLRDAVEARYENGFLRVTLPKHAEAGRDERRTDMQRAPRSNPRSQPLQASDAVDALLDDAPSASIAALMRSTSSGPLLSSLTRGGLHDA